MSSVGRSVTSLESKTNRRIKFETDVTSSWEQTSVSKLHSPRIFKFCSVADKKCDSHFDDDDDDDNDEIDDTKNFSAPRKFSKKKFGATRSISSKNHENRSHPRDF